MIAVGDIRKVIYDAMVNRKPDFLLGMQLRPLLDNDDVKMELGTVFNNQPEIRSFRVFEILKDWKNIHPQNLKKSSFIRVNGVSFFSKLN